MNFGGGRGRDIEGIEGEGIGCGREQNPFIYMCDILNLKRTLQSGRCYRSPCLWGRNISKHKDLCTQVDSE